MLDTASFNLLIATAPAAMHPNVNASIMNPKVTEV